MASTVPDEVAMDMADLLMVAVDTTIVNREEGDNTTGSSLADEEDRRRLLLDMLLRQSWIVHPDVVDKRC